MLKPDLTDRYVADLIRSKPEDFGAYSERTDQLKLHMREGINALQELNRAKSIFIPGTHNYDSLYSLLLSYMRHDGREDKSLLIGIHNDPEAFAVTQHKGEGQTMVNTRYQLHRCDKEAIDQTISLINEDQKTLKSLGVEPADFRWYHFIVAGRIFSPHPITGEDRLPPPIRLIEKIVRDRPLSY